MRVVLALALATVCSVAPVPAGTLAVLAAAASEGAQGLRVGPGSSCTGADHLEVPDGAVTGGVFEGCLSLAANAVEVASGAVTFRAGRGIVLGNGLSVASGAQLATEIDSTLPRYAFVEDDTPTARKTFSARFQARLDDLSLGTDEMTLLAAYDVAGSPEFRVVLDFNATLMENRLFVQAWRDNGTSSSTAGSETLLTAGWHSVQIDWRAASGPGADDGGLEVWVDDIVQTPLAGLDNDLGRIDTVRWGALSVGAVTAGFLDLDDFVSSIPGLLLVPDSTDDRVVAFAADNGEPIDGDVVPPDPIHLATPIHAILNAGGDGILVSDQLNDVVQEYDLEGSFVGTFAPAGGVDNSILDNIRGIALRPNGNLLVTVGSGVNADSVAEFDTSGSYLGKFIASDSEDPNPLASPFDVYARAGDYLVSGISSDAIHRFDLTGASLADLAPIDGFPEQIAETAAGNVLVANFAGVQEGVVELTAAGSLVGVYNPVTLGGYRGVYELDNGNILTTSASGVHEIDRAGNLVETKNSEVSGRFIEFAPLYGAIFTDGFESGDVSAWSSSFP